MSHDRNDLTAFRGMVTRPEPTPGGVGRPKTKEARRFRVKASPQRWAEIRDRKLGDCYVCRYLGIEQTRPATLHHVVAKSLGGSDTESNCVPLCGTGTTGHHGLIEARDPDTCQAFAAALQLYDDDAYSYAIEKLGEDGWLRRYAVKFRGAA